MMEQRDGVLYLLVASGWFVFGLAVGSTFWPLFVLAWLLLSLAFLRQRHNFKQQSTWRPVHPRDGRYK